VLQEEISVFLEVVVSAILRKHVNMKVCLIMTGYRDTAIWISVSNPVKFMFMLLDEVWSLQKIVYTGEALITDILVAAARDKREDQLNSRSV
jgi:hypothetical protein